MKKILTLIAVALLLSTSFSFAQKHRVPSRSAGTELKLADNFYAQSYYYTAAEYYKNVVRDDSSNRYAHFWLGMALLQARDYENAEVFFRKFYEIKPGEKLKLKSGKKKIEFCLAQEVITTVKCFIVMENLEKLLSISINLRRHTLLKTKPTFYLNWQI